VEGLSASHRSSHDVPHYAPYFPPCNKKMWVKISFQGEGMNLITSHTTIPTAVKVEPM
jgi:hypothetical protein